MNADQFRALLWLRWRLRANQFKRGGKVNAIIFAILVAMAVSSMLTLALTGLTLGFVAMPEAPPHVQMFIWDGIILVVLFMWTIGLLADLQRTESLALDRLMHLPISLRGAFFINYLSSLVTLTMGFFLPCVAGLLFGQGCSQPWLFLAFPLVLTFVFALTALTYQFQGWLALLMANPRRRRTIIVGVTASFVLLAQLPNLLNVYKPWDYNTATLDEHQQKMKDLGAEFAGGKLKPDEYSKRSQALIDEMNANIRANNERFYATVDRYVSLGNTALPPGWVALGVRGLAEGNPVPALLGMLGFTGIGLFSLHRAYKTTLRLYAGATNNTSRRTTTSTPTPLPTGKLLVERSLPWCSAEVSAVAVTGFRGLSRAPEVKMMMVGPLMMLIMMGTIFGSRAKHIPQEFGPLFAFGSAAMTVLITVQLIANQFGYDRNGFRAFVLGPLPRWTILFGKNLAIAPFSLGMACVSLVIAGVVFPMRIDHYPAVLLQTIALYLLSGLFMNIVSIYSPTPIALGSMRPAQVKWLPVVLQMAFMCIFPVVILPLMLPYGLEVLLQEFGMPTGIPVFLLGAVGVFTTSVWFYRRTIVRQGEWLHRREQQVLEVVTSKEE